MDKQQFMDYVREQIRGVYGQEFLDATTAGTVKVDSKSEIQIDEGSEDQIRIRIDSIINHAVDPYKLGVFWGLEMQCALHEPKSAKDFTAENCVNVSGVTGYVVVNSAKDHCFEKIITTNFTTVSTYEHKGSHCKLGEDPTGKQLEDVIPELLAAYRR